MLPTVQPALDVEQQVEGTAASTLNLWGHFTQIAKGAALVGASLVGYLAFSRWATLKDTNQQVRQGSSNRADLSEELITPGARDLPALTRKFSESVISQNELQEQLPAVIQSKTPYFVEQKNIRYRPKTISRSEPVERGTVDASYPIQTNPAYDYQPMGLEFRVNTHTSNDQVDSAIAALSDGGFVITWESYLQDGSQWGIYAQMYDANGMPNGQEFRVNTYTTSNQQVPRVAAFNHGGFVITWTSLGQDGSEWGVYAQRYDINGIPIDQEFRVNTYTLNSQSQPAVTTFNHGGFVITWQSTQDGSFDYGYNVYAQRYDANGAPVGAEFKVNTSLNYRGFSRIATLHDGGFVITWMRFQDNNYCIYAQRYDANGMPVNQEFQVNTYNPSLQTWPVVAALNDGGFIITWANNLQDGNLHDIYAQRYDVNSVPVGQEFRVNTYTPNDQTLPAITALNDGGFAITWGSDGQIGENYEVYTQRYDADSTPVGQEFRVNTHTPNAQCQPAITMLNDGGFVITWQSSLQDGSGYGIYAQRYEAINLIPTLSSSASQTESNEEQNSATDFPLPSDTIVTSGSLRPQQTSDIHTSSIENSRKESIAISAWQSNNQAVKSLFSSKIIFPALSTETLAYSQSPMISQTESNEEQNSATNFPLPGDTIATSSSLKPQQTSGIRVSSIENSRKESIIMQSSTSAVYPDLQLQQTPVLVKIGQAVLLTAQHLSIVNPQAQPEAIMYTVQAIQYGWFANINNVYLPISQFSQAQINAGQIQLVHDGSKNIPACRFSVFDGRQTLTNVILTVELMAVLKLVNNRLTIQSGQTLTLTTEYLLAEGNEPSRLVFKLLNIEHGYFQLKQQPGKAKYQFTQQQLQDGQVQFVHDGSKQAPNYAVVVADEQDQTEPVAAQIVFLQASEKNQSTLIIGLSAGLGGALAVGMLAGAVGFFAYKCRTSKIKPSRPAVMDDMTDPTYMEVIGNSYIDATENTQCTEMKDCSNNFNV